MKKIQKSRILKAIISLTLTFSLALTPLIPAAEAEMRQAAFRQVLETDLSMYEGDRIAISDADSLDLNQTDTEKESEEEFSGIWLDQSYETDRFIVKYKESANIEAVEQALHRAAKVKHRHRARHIPTLTKRIFLSLKPNFDQAMASFTLLFSNSYFLASMSRLTT